MKMKKERVIGETHDTVTCTRGISPVIIAHSRSSCERAAMFRQLEVNGKSPVVAML
jgi:hypothetical protein